MPSPERVAAERIAQEYVVGVERVEALIREAYAGTKPEDRWIEQMAEKEDGANVAAGRLHLPLESDGTQGSTVQGADSRKAEQLPCGISGRPQGSDESERAEESTPSDELVRVLRLCIGALREELAAAGSDEVKNHPTLKGHDKILREAERILKERTHNG